MITRRWAALRSQGAQRGTTTTISLAIWLPFLVILVLVGGAGYNTWSYARELAEGAAQIGAQQAALSPTSTDRGQAAAEQFITVHGSGSLGDVQVQATITGDTVTVVITGHAKGLLSDVVPAVSASSASVLEPAQ